MTVQRCETPFDTTELPALSHNGCPIPYLYLFVFIQKRNLIGKVVSRISITGRREDLQNANEVIQHFAEYNVHATRSQA